MEKYRLAEEFLQLRIKRADLIFRPLKKTQKIFSNELSNTMIFFVNFIFGLEQQTFTQKKEHKYGC